MTTKFDNIRIIKFRQQRILNGRLSEVQKEYLLAMGLNDTIFIGLPRLHMSTG